jgi:hypothetical protein
MCTNVSVSVNICIYIYIYIYVYIYMYIYIGQCMDEFISKDLNRKMTASWTLSTRPRIKVLYV